MKKLVLLLVLGLAVSAQAGLVPNGGFEEIYKPGTSTTGVIEAGKWTAGVGPDAPIDVWSNVGVYEFADSTTGTVADIPGWVGFDPEGWRACGGTYGRPEESGNNQGAVSPTTPHSGINQWGSNGGGWGNAAGGLIVSDAPLVRPATSDGSYMTSMWARGNAGPVVLDLYVGGVKVTPDAEVTPALTGDYQQVTRTYNTLPAGDVTLVIGVGRDPDCSATGGQSTFDDVMFIPEPATMTLLGLGGLALLRRRK